MAYNKNKKDQAAAPQAIIKYEAPETVIERLGFVTPDAKAFVYAAAALMKVDEALLAIPENVAEVVKAAEYTKRYSLTPGIHLHMQGPFKTTVKRKVDGKTVEIKEERIALVVGEQAYKTAARIQAQQAGDFLDWEWEPLTPDQMRAYVKEHYPNNFELTDEDVMIRARVLSRQAAEMARLMGRKYDPEWVYAGVFYRGVPATGYGGEVYYPQSDKGRVPSHRTALDKAVQRGIKKATMQRYGLVPLDSLSEDQRVKRVIQDATPAAQNTWMPAEHPGMEPEDDPENWGNPSGPASEVNFYPAGDAGDEDLHGDPGEDDSAEGYDSADEVIDAAFAPGDDLHIEIQDWMAKMRRSDQSPRPASAKMYRYAVSVIEKITGQETHVEVLSIIYQRQVDAQHPLTYEDCQAIFDLFRDQIPEKQADGTTRWVDNPRYDPEAVEFLSAIAKAVCPQVFA